MNRILVELFVPALGKTYEVWIPNDISIAILKRLLSRAILDMSEGQLIINESNVIMNENGCIYQKDTLIEDTDIINGTKLLVI